MVDKLQKVRNRLAQLPHNEFWQIGSQTGEFLRNQVVALNAQNVLEIGTSSGFSALYIIEGLLETGGKLFTVESHKERYEMALQNFNEAEVSDHVVQIFGHAPEALSKLSETKLDMAFFDATKYETILFFQAIWPKMKKSGKIFVDNINSHRNDFTEFFDYLQAENIQYEIMDIESGVMIVEKN